jgi:hypothetical protein
VYHDPISGDEADATAAAAAVGRLSVDGSSGDSLLSEGPGVQQPSRTQAGSVSQALLYAKLAINHAVNHQIDPASLLQGK